MGCLIVPIDVESTFAEDFGIAYSNFDIDLLYIALNSCTPPVLSSNISPFSAMKSSSFTFISFSSLSTIVDTGFARYIYFYYIYIVDN